MLGAAVAIVALAAMYASRAWEEVVNFVLGVWSVASPWVHGSMGPWVLGFADHKEATLHIVIVGVIVSALALWAAMHDHDFGHHLHHGGSAY